MFQSKDHNFTFKYELFGNDSDFEEVYQIVARDFRFIHWLNEETEIEALRNFTIRRKTRKNGE
jgi:hypothetical protein